MKYLLIAIFTLSSFFAKAQTDTTVVTNFTIQLQDALVLSPYLFVAGDSAKLNLYIRYNTAIISLGTVTVTTPVTVSYISIANILMMYQDIANTPVGFGLLAPFQTSLATYRSANSNLNRQCTALETNYINQKNAYFLALYSLAVGH